MASKCRHLGRGIIVGGGGVCVVSLVLLEQGRVVSVSWRCIECSNVEGGVTLVLVKF